MFFLSTVIMKELEEHYTRHMHGLVAIHCSKRLGVCWNIYTCFLLQNKNITYVLLDQCVHRIFASNYIYYMRFFIFTITFYFYFSTICYGALHLMRKWHPNPTQVHDVWCFGSPREIVKSETPSKSKHKEFILTTKVLTHSHSIFHFSYW